MPLPGGPADKFGNRYEGRWTVACFADVLDEHADAIRLEPLGIEGEGVEFWLKKGSIREYHQVKRQYGASGRWTLAELAAKGVLTHFWEKLNDPTAHCVFVSTHAAFQLDELADRARSPVPWEVFEREFLRSGTQSEAFNDLCQRLGRYPLEVVYDGLKRVRIETVSEAFLHTTVESRLATLVEGDPATVADTLGQLALDKVHHELTAHDIWHHIESRGFRRRQWGNDPHVFAAVKAANDRYLTPLRDSAVNSHIIPRDEVEDILDTLTSQDERRGVLLVGEAGVGKSEVILQVVDSLRQQGVPTLTLRIDRFEPTQLPDNVGEQIGLPASDRTMRAHAI